MKEKKLFTKVGIPLYHADIAISLAQTKQELDKSMSEFVLDKKDYEIGELGRAIKLGKAGPYLLWVKYYPDSPKNLAVLLHELHHITNFILQDRDIIFSHESEEAFTYLFEYMAQEILTELKYKL